MKLNLGAGKCPLQGYDNIDLAYSDVVSHIHKLTCGPVYPLPHVDESCDEVRASHVLEHFPHSQSADILREWIRVLKPGGWLKIAVPDFKYIAKKYLEGKEDLPLTGYLMGGQTDENDYHKAVFDWDGLEEAFRSMGLVNIQRWTSEIQDCASLPVSLNIMGQKPETATQSPVCEARQVTEIPKGEVIALWSMPRLGFTDTFLCATMAFTELGITVFKRSGVFWGQCQERLLEEAMERGAKYALTCDYDSLFTADDIRTLYALAEAYDAPAICALQMRRDLDSPLFTTHWTPGAKEVEISMDDLRKDLLPVESAHFGLTLIRLDALKSVQKPWFQHIPDDKGGWNEGKVDEDIHFWHVWKEAGHSIHVAPRVVIGHLQMIASWPDKTLHAGHQYVSEYNAMGKPDWAWK